jgi:hypothetical protein
MNQVSQEIAEKEVTEWLDYKKVFKSVREENDDKIKLLIEGIMEGVLIFNEDHTITHKLLMPLTNDRGEETVKELNYRARINDNVLQSHYKGVSPTDGDARLHAVIAGLTDSMKGIIAKLDSLDKKISVSIAVFFI